jgi:hypothetical protein
MDIDVAQMDASIAEGGFKKHYLVEKCPHAFVEGNESLIEKWLEEMLEKKQAIFLHRSTSGYWSVQFCHGFISENWVLT